jgi:hypothetical protein
MRQHFATQSENAVIVMIVEVISKGFFADQESSDAARYLGAMSLEVRGRSW